MSSVASGAAGVMRGNTDAIRRVGADPQATDQTIPVVFLAVLIATLRKAADDPVGWAVSGFAVACIGLVLYVAALWLIGKAFEGNGRFISLFRAGGFSVAPLALVLIPGVGVAAGVVWTFFLAVRMLHALHVAEAPVAVIAALLPAMFIIGTVVIASTA